MPSTRAFTTAAKATSTEDVVEPIKFMVDDDEITAYPPTPGQFAIMVTRSSEYAKDTERAAGQIDFFLGMLDEPSKMIIGNRLLDREDKLDLDDIAEIFTWLLGEFSARPTKSPSGSPTSGRSTGRKSTVSVPVEV